MTAPAEGGLALGIDCAFHADTSTISRASQYIRRDSRERGNGSPSMCSISLFVLERILAIPRLPGPCAAVFTNQITERGLSPRDEGGDHHHNGLPPTKVRGFPESPRANARARLRENPERSRVNSPSRLTHFAPSPICDRCAILIERNIITGFPSSAHSHERRKGLLPLQ